MTSTRYTALSAVGAMGLGLVLSLTGCQQSLVRFQLDAGCAAARLDTVDSCGQCGNACAAPLNAVARCVAGQCGRGPCAAGFFDLDGTVTPGCEGTCLGLFCTQIDGGTLTLSSLPVPELGATGGSMLSAAASGTSALTGGGYRHVGGLGESPGAPSAISSSHSYLHYGGLTDFER